MVGRFTALAIAATFTLAGCTHAETSIDGVDQAKLAGLPSDVVAERLADPVFVENLSGFPLGERTGVVQLNVASAIFCRDLYGQYEQWTITATTPHVPSVATPDTPEPGFNEFMAQWSSSAQKAIDAGDPAELRSYLLLTLGCRDTIVDPRDAEKRTVAELLEGR